MSANLAGKTTVDLTERIDRAINNHTVSRDLDPKDFEENDVKLVAKAARVKAKMVWEYISHWYLGVR